MPADQPNQQEDRAAEARRMSSDELRRALRPLNLNVQGGLSRARRTDLVTWYVMNTPRTRRPVTSLDNQNRAGAAGGKRGLFYAGRHLADVPAGDVDGETTRAVVAVEHDIPKGQIEVLLVCLDHPTTAAVDCTICVPE